MPQITNIRRRRRGNYFNQSGRYFNSVGADEEIDFEVICTANPSDPACASVNVGRPTPAEATTDPQTAYAACLKGGGSFASCNQIPGVTPEMILAAKAGKLLGGGPSPSIGKTVVIVAAAGLALYLLTR